MDLTSRNRYQAVCIALRPVTAFGYQQAPLEFEFLPSAADDAPEWMLRANLSLEQQEEVVSWMVVQGDAGVSVASVLEGV